MLFEVNGLSKRFGQIESRQLTKSALPDGDTEKVARHGQRWAFGPPTGDMAAPERDRFPALFGHSQPVHGAAPLTRRTESSKSDYLPRQTGFEPPTFWLTGAAYSRCDLARRERVPRELTPRNSSLSVPFNSSQTQGQFAVLSGLFCKILLASLPPKSVHMTRSGTVHNTSPADRDRRRKPSLRPLGP